MSCRTRNRIRTWVLASLATALCACVPLPDRTDPVQYLDRDTAVTFLVVSRPMIFAHVRPQVAARVRDYATVAAAYMDRNGRVDYVLLVYLWSTVDPRNVPGAMGSAPDLVLAADDRRIALYPGSGRPQALPPVDRPPVRQFVAAIYRTDLPTLRYLTVARHLALLRDAGRDEVRFELWDDQRPSLAGLVRTRW